MKARTAVFALVSLRPHPLRHLVKRLPYAPPTIYEAVRKLEEEGLVTSRSGGVSVAEGYRSRKLSEIYISALTHGVDPERLMRDSTISVWRKLEAPSTIKELCGSSGLSEVSVKKALKYLREKGLVEFLKGKPLLAVRNKDHPLNRQLISYYQPPEEADTIYYPGTAPFQQMFVAPDRLERLLFERIDQALAVKETGFLIKGEGGGLTILESVPHKLGLEELFLAKLLTPEGAEEFCLLLLAQKRLDYRRLLELAGERGLVNIVGCYLEVVNQVKEFVPPDVIHQFENKRTPKQMTFLAQEKEYGKGGWEGPYEKRWNIDLYLDLGAIRHGVRAL